MEEFAEFIVGCIAWFALVLIAAVAAILGAGVIFLIQDLFR